MKSDLERKYRARISITTVIDYPLVSREKESSVNSLVIPKLPCTPGCTIVLNLPTVISNLLITDIKLFGVKSAISGSALASLASLTTNSTESFPIPLEPTSSPMSPAAILTITNLRSLIFRFLGAMLQNMSNGVNLSLSPAKSPAESTGRTQFTQSTSNYHGGMGKGGVDVVE